MDRRDFVRRTLAAAATLGAGSMVQAATTPKPPILGRSQNPPNNIAISVKRFDGGSGSATFSGVIPFKPRQVTTSTLTNISVWDGANELPVNVEALSPLHPDGSLKAARIQTSLSLARNLEKALTLRLDAKSTAAPLSSITVDTKWMRAPLLLACTDAAHLCSSRVAPAPLVPTDHPNLPAKWRTFLTDQFDGVSIEFGPSPGRALATHRAGRKHAAGGNANYENISACYYRYLTSGQIDKLADAHFLMTESVQYNIRDLTHGNGAMTETSTGAPYDTDLERYGNAPLSTYGIAEWNSGFRADMYICYALSGWEQAKRTLIADGARGYLMHGSNASQYGGRFDWRLKRTGALFYGLLSEPLDLTYSIPRVFTVDVPNIVDNRQMWLDRVVANHFDKIESWSRGFPANDYRYGVWGCAANFDGGNGRYPNFQAITVFNDLVFAYLNFVQDVRVPRGLHKLCDLIYDQTHPFASNAFGPAGQLFANPYLMTDPTLPQTGFDPTLGSNNDSPWSVTMTMPMMAWAYAYTGDTKYLSIADAHADIHSWVYQSNLGDAGNGWKQIGECYHMAYHAAAWRAGVSHGSWDLT